MATEHDAAIPSFGDLLRRHRLDAGMTQPALAELAGLSKRGISDLERSARTRPQRETVKLLADALGLAGPKRALFVAAARQRKRASRHVDAAAAPASLHTVPLPSPLDTLVGRELEVAAVTAMVRHRGVRLVTLTGPGGVGKTRLALAAGAALHDDFPDGAVFVDLAPIRDPALALPALAERLGIREASGPRLAQRLRDRLATQTMLLVLDNVEQVLEIAPAFAELLTACPGVRVLATSRSPLRVAGEHVFSVPPLSLPERAIAISQDRLSESEAVRLFVARATAANAGFALDDANGVAVAEVCRRLDGLPLAIELAASRVALLPPDALLARMEPRLPMLTGGRRDAPARQQTMSAAIEWSYDLLDAAAQRLFRQLAVFVGGWTLEAAEAVAHDGERGFLAGLAGLVDAHLIARQSGVGSDVRFGMLETVREFGLERLGESGEEDAVRHRHAMHFVAQVEAAGPWLEDNRGGPWRTGAGIDQWLDRLTVEFPNVRAAADWAVRRREGEVLLRLGCAIYPFFNTYSLGESREGRRWLEAGLAAGSGLDVSLRIWALGFASSLATVDGDHEQGVSLAEEGLMLARVHGNRRGEAEALDSLAFSAMFRGDLKQAEALYSDLLKVLQGSDRSGESPALNAFSGGRPADDPEWIAHTFDSLAQITLGQGDLQRAAALAEHARAMLPAEGCSAHHARLFGSLAAIALAEGDDRRATRFWRESLQQWRSLRNRRGVADGLAGLATVLQARGEPENAAHLLGAAEALLEEVGARHLIHAVALDHVLTTVRSSREERTMLAWEQGRTRPAEDVVSDALAEPQSPFRHSPPQPAGPVSPSPP